MSDTSRDPYEVAAESGLSVVLPTDGADSIQLLLDLDGDEPATGGARSMNQSGWKRQKSAIVAAEPSRNGRPSENCRSS